MFSPLFSVRNRFKIKWRRPKKNGWNVRFFPILCATELWQYVLIAYNSVDSCYWLMMPSFGKPVIAYFAQIKPLIIKVGYLWRIAPLNQLLADSRLIVAQLPANRRPIVSDLSVDCWQHVDRHHQKCIPIYHHYSK